MCNVCVCVACIYHNYSAKCNQWVRLWSRYDIESCALSVCRIWLYQVGLSMDRQCVHVCWCMCSVVYTGSAPFIWYLERRTSARNNYYVFALHCTRMQTGASGKKCNTVSHSILHTKNRTNEHEPSFYWFVVGSAVLILIRISSGTLHRNAFLYRYVFDMVFCINC